MNKEAIDLLIEKNPKLKGSRHAFERMQPEAYCIHRSWGFGQIKSYDQANNKLLIDFQDGKEGHAMDPAFCVDKLEILDEENLLVQQQIDPDAVATMIKKQPVDVVIEFLSSKATGEATTSELEAFLARLLGETKFKKWWTNTKKLLIKDPRVAVPVKKTDPYLLRDEPLSPEQEILEEFYANKQAKKKILLAEKLYQLSDSVEDIANDLPQILDDLTQAVSEAKQLSQGERLHGVWVRNDLARHLCEDVETLEPTSTSIIKATDNLDALAEEIPSGHYKRLLDLISRVYPDDWMSVAINLLKNSTGKFTSECIAFLIERDYADLINESFDRWLAEQTFRGPVLYWIVKNRNTRRFQKFTKEIIGYKLLIAILIAIENEAIQSTGNRRILLGDILSDDPALIPDLLSDANEQIAKDLAQRLLHSQGFEDLTKKSLIARFIKQYPAIQALVAGDSHREAENLIVSQSSLDARKEEYDTLINIKIPENKEAIATARDHGDLKENAEYKMARQDQEILLSKKSLLEGEMARARVTDFSDATEDQVGIGSVVELHQGSSGKSHSYAILGAWDSDPEKNILSYKTPLGQSLFNKSVGDEVKTEIDGNEETWTIKNIKRWVDSQ